MKIRKALKTDITSIIELTHQLGYPVDEKNFKYHFDTILEKRGHVVFVAEEINSKVIAYIHVLSKELLISPDSVEIGEMIVDQNYRRKGIGKHLIEHAENWATENGYKSIIVGSSTKRKTSHLFYPNAGFTFWKEQILYSKELEK